MKVILINPNSTEAMTVSSIEAAQRAVSEIEFVGWTSFRGPRSIQGPEDGEQAIGPLLELVNKAVVEKPLAIILGCFDDTGLQKAKQICECPVLGIGEASFVLSSLHSSQTAVITTVKEAVPIIKNNISNLGYQNIVTDVIAADAEVLELEYNQSGSAMKFAQASESLNPKIKNIILGCAGAVNIKNEFERLTGYKTFDGVTSAAKLCRALL
jgi:allantoin racemase